MRSVVLILVVVCVVTLSVEAAGPTAVQPYAWFKADAGVAEAGGAVSGWADQSGNAADVDLVSHGTVTLVPGALNGLPVVRFGADGFAGAPTTFRIAPDAGVTILGKWKKNDSWSGEWQFVYDAYWNPRAELASSGTSMWIGGTGNPPWTWHEAAFDLAAFPAETWLQTTVRHTADGIVRVYGSQFAGTYNMECGIDGFNVAARDGSMFLNGDFAEILVYEGGLNDTEIADVEAYLAAKYIPEPMTMSLVAIGGLLLARRRR